MVESFNSKRVVFLKGKQRIFLNSVIDQIPIVKIAEICDRSQRTVRDWRREKFLMDFAGLNKICKKLNIPLPSEIKLKDKYWYTANGSSAGGTAVYKKYRKIGGDPEYRKKKWYEWWEKEGRYKKHPIIGVTKPIKKAIFSKGLSEFVGIVLGDGGITRSQVTITLHSKDDREYSKFVINLIKKLFEVPVCISYDKKSSAVDLIVSRVELVRFCVQKLGLKQGNKIKQQVGVPLWIRRNSQYSIACLRGLIDTDGCLFSHRYKVNGKFYNYKKISFTSYSDPLRQSVFNILKNNGFHPRFAQRKDVRLDRLNDVKRYFRYIGSNNPKYLKRYKK
ncbi:MAG: hypothetical protein ABIG40_00835 [Parcubacteria group bacterium]